MTTIQPEPLGSTLAAGVTTIDLARRLDGLERDLRHAWVDVLEVSSDAAARFGAAGRLIHRARALLDDTSQIY